MLPSECESAIQGRWDYCILVCCGACDKRGVDVFLTPPCLLFGESCARAHGRSYYIWTANFLIPCTLLIVATIGLVVAMASRDGSGFSGSWVTAMIVLGSLWIAAFLTIVTMGTVNRNLIQSRFRIDSSHSCPPLLIWSLFFPCALCQETRTLRLNNVDEGVWHGGTATPEISEKKYRLFSLV